MKKINFIIIIAVLLFAACEKETSNVSKVVKVSYPTITLKGAAYVHISVGAAYTDAGATLKDDVTGAVSDITAKENSVDPSTPGIYEVSYEAANSNGFKTTATRTVLVLDYTAPAGLKLNLSGAWLRTNGIPVNYYEMESGLYSFDNFAGSALVYPAYLITPDDSTISIPAQTSFGLALDCINETLKIAPPDTTISYSVISDPFGDSKRTFNKVH